MQYTVSIDVPDMEIGIRFYRDAFGNGFCLVGQRSPE